MLNVFLFYQDLRGSLKKTDSQSELRLKKTQGGRNMKKEQLIELGISDEVAKQVMAIHGTDVTKYKNELSTSQQTIADLETKISDRDKDLNKLRKDNSNNEELQNQLNELKQQYKDAEKAHQDKLLNIQKESALTSLIGEYKAKNSKAIAALLDQEKIVFKDGELSGVKEQLDALKESDSYLFDLGTGTSYGPQSGNASTQKVGPQVEKLNEFRITK